MCYDISRCIFFLTSFESVWCFSDSVKVPSNLCKAMYTEIDCHEILIKVIKLVVFPNLHVLIFLIKYIILWMRAALFIQLNFFVTIRIKKDFHECFAGKLLFAPPKKTLTLLWWCSYISNLELNHINSKDYLPTVNMRINWRVLGCDFRGFWLGFF